MHLVTCDRPQEPFEAAPESGLLADLKDGNRWDGFWSAGSDEYYVRRTSEDGETEWYRLEDDVAPARSSEVREARVLTLRPANRSRVSVVVAQSPDGRRMLVGSAGRTTR